MAPRFAHDKPLQALKLGAVIAVLVFGIAVFFGLLAGRGLDGLLLLAFFPMVLAVVVAGEVLLAGFRLARTEDPSALLAARPVYTVIRAIEVVVTVGAPATFYVLVVRIGGEVAGPGAVGLLFIGIGLGLLACGAVLVRTLAEYYYHRRDRTSPDHLERGGNVAE